MFNGGRLVPGGIGGQRRPPPSLSTSPTPTAIDSSECPRRAWGTRADHVGFADGFAFAGFSAKGFAKFDLSKPSFPRVATGTSDLPGRDEDFGTLPWATWSSWATIIRARAAASSPTRRPRTPRAPGQHGGPPKDGSANQPLTSRVGITLTDAVEAQPSPRRTSPCGPWAARPWRDGTPPERHHQLHSEGRARAPGTQYEVVVREDGLKDYAGNPVQEAFRSVFTTTKQTGTGTSRDGASAAKASRRGPSLQVGAAGAAPRHRPGCGSGGRPGPRASLTNVRLLRMPGALLAAWAVPAVLATAAGKAGGTLRDLDCRLEAEAVSQVGDSAVFTLACDGPRGRPGLLGLRRR